MNRETNTNEVVRETPDDAIEEQNIAALSYLNGGVLEKQGTWNAPSDQSELNGRWDKKWILSAYLALTDRMIGLMGGYSHEDDQPVIPDKVFFLDKSARPVAWLIDALWDQMAGKGREKPEFDFINFDRKMWWSIMGHPLVGEENRDISEFRINEVPQDEIDRIRARFVDGELSLDNYNEQVWKLPTVLDGKKIMLVDEVKSSGATLHMAKLVLSRAIPEAEFYGKYFWELPYSEGKSVEIYDRIREVRTVQWQMFNLPVWYDKDSPAGRNILDPVKRIREDVYQSDPTQRNLKDLLSWFVHSTTIEEAGQPVDEKAQRLLADFAMLSYLGNIEQFFIPESDTWYRRQLGAVAAKLGVDPESPQAVAAVREKWQEIRKHKEKRTA